MTTASSSAVSNHTLPGLPTVSGDIPAAATADNMKRSKTEEGSDMTETWERVDTEEVDALGHSRIHIRIKDTGEFVCSCGSAANPDNAERARLIVAAPEMLEALQMARNVIRHVVQESSGRVKSELVGGWEHHASEIEDTIALSTGQEVSA